MRGLKYKPLFFRAFAVLAIFVFTMLLGLGSQPRVHPKFQVSWSVDPRAVEEIDASISDVYSLAGIERFTNLKRLKLDNWPNVHADGEHPRTTMSYAWCGSPPPQQIGPPNVNGDLRPLASLMHLEVLDLSAAAGTNGIPTSLAPLAGKASMKELYLRFGQVTDVETLGTLSNLEVLDLWNGYIRDWSFLPRLTQLRELYVGGTTFSDMTLLRNCQQLEILDVSGCEQLDFTVLNDLPNLRVVNLNGTWSWGQQPPQHVSKQFDALRARGVRLIYGGSLDVTSGLVGSSWTDVD